MDVSSRDRTLAERMRAIEVMMDESQRDRASIHKRIDSVGQEIKAQLREQDKRQAWYEAARWIAALAAASLFGYYFQQMFQTSQHNGQKLDQLEQSHK